MNTKQKIDVLKHIKLGIKEIFYYNYEGDPLPLRPISSFELDDCFYKSLSNATSKVFELVVKLRLKLIKDDERNQEVTGFSNEDYLSLQRHYDSIAYWVVYYSMKDFQNEDFQIPTLVDGMFLPKGMIYIRQMNHIHDISQVVLDSSYKPKEIIKEVILDDGLEVGYCVFYLNTPLSNITDITRLQRDYLLYSKGEIVKLQNNEGTGKKKKEYIISGQKMTMAEAIEKFYGKDVLQSVKNRLNEGKPVNNPFSGIKIQTIKDKLGEYNDTKCR